jgi:type VI secretion system FHA domain protein
VSSGVGGGGGRAAPALDDWDLSPPPGAAAQRVQPPPPHRPSAAAVTPPVPGAHGPAPAAGLSDPFADEAPLVVPSAAAPAGAGIAPACAVPPMRAAATPAPGPAAARMAGGGGGGDAAAGLAAFLAGAGLSPAVLQGQAATDPDAALRALGTAFRAIVAGLRALLIARADVKREFRIEQTLLRPAGNNPIKFAATDEAAMLALASQGARGVGAVQETVADLTAHQVATLAATQAAARALLDRLAPAGLEAEVKGGGSLFGGGREKLLWDSYRKLHQQVVDQFEDDFDSAFGKAFARAYEQAVKRDAGR